MLLTTSAFADDIYYCRGGLVGVEPDWGQNTLYPLTKGEDGIYSGEVDMVARTEMTPNPTLGYGNRVDLFFDKNNTGALLKCATNGERFITPGRTEWRTLKADGGEVFQCVGGKYKVYLDVENNRVRFEAIEPAWLEEVILYGMVKDCRWQVLGENTDNGVKARLVHQGNGIYTGQFTFDESSDGMSDFCVRASYAGDNNEGRYSSSVANLQLIPGVAYPCDRYNGDRNWRVPTGTYNITFDMNHQTIRVNTPEDPDLQISLAYAELEIAIQEAEARFPGIDLSSVKSVLNNSESTDEQLTEAKNSLPALQTAYLLNQMKSAGEGNPVDASYFIKDATCTNGEGWGGTAMTYEKDLITTRGKNFNAHQEITNLPNGVYKLALKGTSRYGAGNVYYTQAKKLDVTQRNLLLYATGSGARMNKTFGDIHDTQYGSLASDGATSEADFSGEGWFSPTNAATAKLWMKQGRYADNHVLAYVNDGTLTIGLTREKHQADDALYADDWSLTYYGDSKEALALIANDVEETYEDYQTTMAQTAAKDALEAAMSNAKDADNLAEAYKTLAEAESALRKSQVAYASFQKKIESIKAQLAEQPELTGPAAVVLDKYLNENIAPNDVYAHGTAGYIMENGTLNVDEMTAEEAVAEELLSKALKGNIVAGTDITSLFTNADWSQKDWAGWTVEKKEDNNATSNSNDGLESMRLATWWNWASGSITQTLEGMPDGIYALSYNGFLRTGQAHKVDSSDEINTFAVVGNIHTPIKGAYDDALPLAEAEEGKNCASDDYKTDEVRYPGSANGASVAFTAGRYAQTAYGMAQDGKLTIGWINDGYPNYWEDWFVVGGIKVTYLGTTEEAADAMVANAQTRGENMLASMLGYREDTHNNLEASMDSKADDYAAKCEKAQNINKYCDEARQTAPHYAALETATVSLSDRANYAYQHNGISEEKKGKLDQEVSTVQGNLMAGIYSAEEAEQLAVIYTKKADDLIPMQARGGLEGVGNWAANETYLLFKNDEGIYEGNISMVNASDLSSENKWWGNRGDLFFVDQPGFFYGSIGSPQGYITPADTAAMRVQKRWNSVQSPFQLQGGKYHILLDMDNLTVKFQCTEEFWMDSLYCVGTLKDFRYTEDWETWKQKAALYPLKHTEHGIYKGKVIVEAEGDEESQKLGLLAVMSNYNTNVNEGRYASSMRTELKHGITHEAPRAATTTDVSNNFFTVEPGEWLVTFDMNNGTIRLNKADDPDYAEEGVVEENVTWYAIGGLDGTGNWEQTTKYPLVKNKDGKYEGVVKFTDETLEMTNKRWGNRSDLFFRSSLGLFMEADGDLDNDQKFITPAKNKPMPASTRREQGGIKVFQALAGTYKVVLDEDNLTVQFDCLEEKWLPAVYVRGTLKNFRWKHEVQADSLNVLRHIGHGIYQGVIELEEDNSVTSGKFAIKADFDEGGTEAIYCPAKDATPIEKGGAAVPVYRWNDQSKCVLAPIGKLLVTFDMNHGWVKIDDPDNPSSIEKLGLTTLPKNAQVGIYTLDGRKVYSGMSQWNTATPGIYIMVKDGQAKKVLVK